MLPDYPRVKGDLSARFLDFLKIRVDFYLGVFSEVKHVRYFEGDARNLTRPSGEVEPGRWKDIQSILTVEKKDIPRLTLTSVVEKLDRLAQDIARQQVELAYETISEAVEKVGNVMDAGGKRITAQTIIEAFGMLDIDFDRNGVARMPQMHISQDLSDAMTAAQRELESDRTMREQFMDLIQEKREEWRAREANRRLVG